MLIKANTALKIIHTQGEDKTMLPSYSCTEITTYTGNTQIYIFRKKKEQRVLYKRYLKKQKILGMALILIGIIGCFVIPEDCGGCLIAGLMGIARVICD